MERFARLYDAIDRTTSTNAKVDAMAAYFRVGARRGRGVGSVLPHRPAVEAASALLLH